MIRESICGKSANDLSGTLKEFGVSESVVLKIANWVYKKEVKEIAQMTNISKEIKKLLSEFYTIGVFPPVTSETSSDKTIKYLFRTRDGNYFETVYLPEDKRHTVCVSTQSGCRMGCPICLTGLYGFSGNLTAGEIVNQIVSLPEAALISHVVFMGMGEPMDNLEEVLKACEILTAEWGLAIGPGKVTVSSVGITPAILEFLNRSECNLTVSLHSPFTDERKMIVPVESIYPVHEIIRIMKSFPLRKKRRLSLAYVMIEHMNDSDNHLKAIKDLLTGTSIRVNLLPFHSLPGDKHRSSNLEKMEYFKHNLVLAGISASIRKSRGIDISAACGHLAPDFVRDSGMHS